MHFQSQQTKTLLHTLIAAGVLTLGASGSALAQDDNGSTNTGMMDQSSAMQTPTQSGMGNGSDSMQSNGGMQNDTGSSMNSNSSMSTGDGSDYGSSSYNTPPPTQAKDPMKTDPDGQSTGQSEQNSAASAASDAGMPGEDKPESDTSGSSQNDMPSNNPGNASALDQRKSMNQSTTGESSGG